jgi:hypothetical protein
VYVPWAHPQGRTNWTAEHVQAEPRQPRTEHCTCERDQERPEKSCCCEMLHTIWCVWPLYCDAPVVGNASKAVGLDEVDVVPLEHGRGAVGADLVDNQQLISAATR